MESLRLIKSVVFESPYHRDLTIFLTVLFCVVYESFKDYIAKETMDGENKYDAGDNGLQVSLSFIELYILWVTYYDYIAKETMDGENMYDAGDNGLQVSLSFIALYFE